MKKGVKRLLLIAGIMTIVLGTAASASSNYFNLVGVPYNNGSQASSGRWMCTKNTSSVYAYSVVHSKYDNVRVSVTQITPAGMPNVDEGSWWNGGGTYMYNPLNRTYVMNAWSTDYFNLTGSLGF